MGLFDIVKEKVSELLSGAGDKVTELTGTDVAEQVTQSTEGLADTAQGLTGTVTDTATGAVEDLPGSVSDAITDTNK